MLATPPDLPPVLSACCRPPRPSQNNKSTPLILAAKYGHASIVQKLLAAGADPTLKDEVSAAAAVAREGAVGGRQGWGAWGGAWP